MQDPSFFQQFMNQLAQTQPQLHQLISQNPQQFLRLILNPSGGGEGGPAMGGDRSSNVIQITSEENEASRRLESLGFSRHRAAEAFFSCDKNEEWAANFLFENAANDDVWEQQIDQQENAEASPSDGQNQQPAADQNNPPASQPPAEAQPQAQPQTPASANQPEAPANAN